MIFYVYVATDSHGNKDEGVVNSSSSNLCISGMNNKDGERIYFESEAYHAWLWGKENDVTITIHEVKLDVINKTLVSMKEV